MVHLGVFTLAHGPCQPRASSAPALVTGCPLRPLQGGKCLWSRDKALQCAATVRSSPSPTTSATPG